MGEHLHDDLDQNHLKLLTNIHKNLHKMKITIEQLDEHQCRLIAKSLNEYADRWIDLLPKLSTEAGRLSKEFMCCTFLLCKYINTDAEKGGNHGL